MCSSFAISMSLYPEIENAIIAFCLLVNFRNDLFKSHCSSTNPNSSTYSFSSNSEYESSIFSFDKFCLHK